MQCEDVFYSNRKNTSWLRENYLLLAKMIPHMLNGRERHCLQYSCRETVEKKIVITKSDPIIRVSHIFLSWLEGQWTPYYDFQILIDETRQWARVKDVQGEEYDCYCMFSVSDMDEEDRFDEIYYDPGYVYRDGLLVGGDCAYREADINQDLSQFLQRILKIIDSNRCHRAEEIDIDVSAFAGTRKKRAFGN